MARSPLTETISRVQGMITYVRENLSTDEYNLFLDLLAPEAEPEVVKTTRKKRKRTSKSARAASLAEQIKGKSGITLCGASLESSGADCNLPEGHALHVDKGYVDHHEFVVPQVAGAGGD
jgi:hypothetical protein